MKRLTILLTLILCSTAIAAYAQNNVQSNEALYIGNSTDNSISKENGKMRVTLNGMCFDFGGNANNGSDVTLTPVVYTNSTQKAYWGFAGIGSPSFNHFALFEIGASSLANLDYSAYTPEEANALMFSSNKSVHLSMNLGTVNVPLNKSRSLVLSAAYGCTIDNYAFAGDYSMELRDGMMRPVKLDGSIKKSKLIASYFHVPLTLDWNIKGGNFFISAGVTLDVLMNTKLKYKFPRTSIDGEVTLNPIQVGATARIGWKRLYAFANYSFIDMFKTNTGLFNVDTGPRGKRLSAGMGIWF